MPAATAAARSHGATAPKNYTVYFDYNSSRLSPAATEIVGLAAGAYKAGAPSSVQVTGYASPPGSAGYNQRLSLRRANAVASQLQQDGVPQAALVVSGQGETSSAPTPAQNQRVAIIIGSPPPAAPSS